MANVLFKRGLQSALDGNNFQPQDGVFYLTTDTHRLYVGQNDGNSTDKVLLNQTVQIVDSIAALSNMSNSWSSADQAAHVNDFYYCTSENVLAVWKANAVVEGQTVAYGWQQINPDTNTTISSFSQSASASAGVATVTSTIQDTRLSGNSFTASFAVSGANGIGISTTGTNGVVISGRTYDLGLGTVTTASAAIELERDDSTTASPVKSSVVLSAGDNISFAEDSGNLEISAVDTRISAVSLSTTNGSLSISIEDTQLANNSHTATLANVGVLVGENSNYYLPFSDVSGASAQGVVYTKAEVDALLNGLDGMTFKGTVGSAGSVAALPISGVKNGDVYLVADEGLTTTSAAFAGATFNTAAPGPGSEGTRVGDMVIASGTEGDDGVISGTITWSYVPAGNDELAQVSYSPVVTTATNTIGLVTGAAGNPGVVTLQLVGGTDIELDSTVSNISNGAQNGKMTTTISHAAITTTANSATADAPTSFDVVSAISTINGHVDGYTITTVTPSVYSLASAASATASASANSATVNMTLQKDSIDSSTASFGLTSNSIALTQGASAGVVNMDIVWGTF